MSNKPNFQPSIGRLSTNRYDFEKHIDGTTFRHDADQIDVSPPVISGATNVQSSLANIAAFIALQAGKGEGFITIPDGYDTWKTANGSQNYHNPDGYSLDQILNPIFNAIINNTTIPAGFERIQRGGIVLIPAGTYIVVNTINVPPGIILMGEGYGTKIVNATSLTNLNTLTPIPKGSPTPLPMFKIFADSNRLSDDSAVDGYTGGAGAYSGIFMFARETALYNMVIADNFVEPPFLGDPNYKLPQNKTGNTPLIQQLSGSNLTIDSVKLMGRIIFSSGLIVDHVFGVSAEATRFAVQLDESLPVAFGTHLEVKNCFVDGFSQPIAFFSSKGAYDFLSVVNNKIRSHGYLDGYDGYVANNCIIKCGYNNANISQNYFYGNSTNIQAAIFVKNQTITTPTLQNRAKINITNNDSIVAKLSNTANYTYATLTYDVLFANPALGYSSSVFGNTFQDFMSFALSTSDDVFLSSFLVLATGVQVKGNFSQSGNNVDITGTSAVNISGPVTISGDTTINGTNAIINSGTSTDLKIASTSRLRVTSTELTTHTAFVPGVFFQDMLDANQVVSIANSANVIFFAIGNANSTRTLTLTTLPTIGKFIIVTNETNQSSSITVQFSSGTGVTIPINTSAVVTSNGTNAIAVLRGTV